MTQQEKDRLHLKKQNRRLYGQLLGIILPPAVTIIIALLLFLFAGIKANLAPSEPFEIRYVKGKNIDIQHWANYTEVTAENDKLYRVSPYLRKEFWQEVEAGNIAPGDKLTVTGYSWLLRDYLMTVSTEEKDLGSFRDFDAWRSRDIHGMRITAFIVPCLGLLCGFLVWRLERKDLREIQKLRRKYRERMRQGKP